MKRDSFEYSVATKDIKKKDASVNVIRDDEKPVNEDAAPMTLEEMRASHEKILLQLRPEVKAEAEQLVLDISSAPYADVEEGPLADRIKTWIEEAKLDIDPDPHASVDVDEEIFENQSWIFFQSLARVHNTESLEKEIEKFRKEEEVDEGRPMNVIERKNFVDDVQGKFPFSKKEIGQLLDFYEATNTQTNTGILPAIKIFNELWHTHGLGRDKSRLGKIAVALLIERFFDSASSFVYKNLLKNDELQWRVFAQSEIFQGIGKIINIFAERYEREFSSELNRKLNIKIAQGIILQDFEHMEGKSSSEMIQLVQRGRAAIHNVIKGILFQIGPIVAGMGISAAMLTRIHPLLGASGLASMPLMLYLANKERNRNLAYFNTGRREQTRLERKLETLQEGMETVRTSEMAPEIAEEVASLMNRLEDLEMEQMKVGQRMDIVTIITEHAVEIMSAAVGYALQQQGLIEGGAILANIRMMHELRRPIERLNEKFQSGYASDVTDIRKLQRFLGDIKTAEHTPVEESNLKSTDQLANFNIELTNVGYQESRDKREILHDVNLTIKQGDFVVLTGATGAGKSTLMRTMVGIYKPTRGEVKIGGTPVSDLRKHGPDSLYSAVAYSTQDTMIFSDMTLRENLLMWSKRESSMQNVEKVLQTLHLDSLLPRLDETVKHLSGGERARVGVARILLREPKIIFMDEPTASLDARTATDVVSLIRQVHESYPDTTIICISHDDRLISAGLEIRLEAINVLPENGRS